jgi:hypothetical protein
MCTRSSSLCARQEKLGRSGREKTATKDKDKDKFKFIIHTQHQVFELYSKLEGVIGRKEGIS